MTIALYDKLGWGITRIDSGMIRAGLAACYLVQSGDEYALVETGTHHTIPIIEQLLSQRGISFEQIRYVIPTHVHLDHAGGVGGLMQRAPRATLLVHPRGARHMIEPEKLKAGAIAVYGAAKFHEIYGDVIPVDAQRVREMQDGEQVKLGNRTLVFHDTPGHARHHFCVQDSQSNGIFTGDTFGLSYPALASARGPFIFPTTTPVQFEPDALQASIRKLLALQPERMFLTHYGMVEHPAALGQRLLVQVEQYAALGRETAQTFPQAEWEAVLEARLAERTVADAVAHGCQQSVDEMQAELAMDMRLNSQGLAVWMKALA